MVLGAKPLGGNFVGSKNDLDVGAKRPRVKREAKRLVGDDLPGGGGGECGRWEGGTVLGAKRLVTLTTAFIRI